MIIPLHRTWLMAALLIAGAAPAQNTQVIENTQYSYSDLADMALTASIVAGVEIRKSTSIKGAAAVGLDPAKARFLIAAEVKTLLRGAGGLPAGVSYLVDLRAGAANHGRKLRKARMIILASPVSGRTGELRLIAPSAQVPWTAENEARIRAVLTEAVAPGAAPRITGIGNAFHVAGSLPGESETQIFLKTDDSRPISLTILRRPGEQPRWAVALGEMVDDSAGPPRPETLLWYRLACGLPRALPDTALAQGSENDRAAIRADYSVVLEGLGNCGRTPR